MVGAVIHASYAIGRCDRSNAFAKRTLRRVLRGRRSYIATPVSDRGRARRRPVLDLGAMSDGHLLALATTMDTSKRTRWVANLVLIAGAIAALATSYPREVLEARDSGTLA